MTKLLTTKEVARQLGVTHQALEKGRCGYGKINPPHIKLGSGRAIRYVPEEVEAWLKQRNSV